MKKVLLALLLIASTGAYAQGISTTPNVFGGENYYQNGRYIGKSTRNVFGGRNFHPSPSARQGFYGYQGYGNPELQSGYAIGAGLRSLIDAFRSNGVER